MVTEVKKKMGRPRVAESLRVLGHGSVGLDKPTIVKLKALAGAVPIWRVVRAMINSEFLRYQELESFKGGRGEKRP